MNESLTAQLEVEEIKRFKPYPEYRGSGVDWLGEIPTHWAIERLKARVANKIIKTPLPNGAPLIDLEHIESNKGCLVEDIELLTLEENTDKLTFDNDDVLFGKLRPYLRKVLRPGFSGYASSEFLVLNPLEQTDPGFLYYFALSDGFNGIAEATSYGTKMPRTSWEKLSVEKFSFPWIEEQRAIASFLDRETAKIDVLIAKKERMIELLQEKRTALITQAVTKGLDPNVPMKDSGVEWLGEIPGEREKRPWEFPLPENWKREPLKFNSYIKGRLGWQNLRSDEYTDEGPFIVSSEQFSLDRVNWEMCNHVTPERYNMAPEIILKRHDILFMKDGAAMGKLAYIDHLPGEACLNSHLLVLRPLRKRYIPKYLYYVLKSPFFVAYMIEQRAGATFFGFSQQSMANFPLTIPPFEIQEVIVRYLVKETAKTDALVDKVMNAIDRLKEYHSALISAAVTGKIDVREEVKT